MLSFIKLLTLLLLSVAAYAQTSGEFGCKFGASTFVHDTELKLVEFTDQARIHEWQSRPALSFHGFAEQKYGFEKADFFRWHVPVKGREGAHQSLYRDYEDHLALAIRLTNVRGESRWFELEAQAYTDLLNIQSDPDVEKGVDEGSAQASQTSPDLPKLPPADAMSEWLVLGPATPDSSIPLFVLAFAYNQSGANAGGTIENQLMLDLRDGIPKLIRAVQCVNWEGGGVCGAPDYAAHTHDALMCSWEKSAADFACTLVGDFGQGYGPRTAQRNFYLISDKPVKPDWQTPDTPADLTAWAARLHANQAMATAVAKIPGIGKATLLRRDSGLVPGSEVMIFASPAQTPSFDERLWLATVPPDGKPAVAQIPVWLISGEELADGRSGEDYTRTDLAGYTPTDLEETFTTKDLERRPGFRAIQTTAAIGPRKEPVHVHYWIGLETVNGNIVANAVRVASDAIHFANCGQELQDGTAISLVRKPGLAEATLRVRPQDPDIMENIVETGEDKTQPACIWTGVLHWKPGSGFRVRKLAQDCRRAAPDVKISDDGKISLVPAPSSGRN